MKKEIMAYITAITDIRGGTDITLKCCLENLMDFVADFKDDSAELEEKNSNALDKILEANTEIAEVNARYVARINELEGEIKNTYADNLKYMDENKDLERRNSVTNRYANRELQELKSQLAETKESLTNMMDNESRLNKRVEKAELVTKSYDIAIGRIFEENQQLHDEIKKLKGPQWKED